MFIIIKKMKNTITSMSEFDRKYFPVFYQKKEEELFLREATPEERGKYMAKKSIDKIIKFLKN